ncbi:MAG: hypothetical protein ACRDRW_09445 [Pseudonocardiaceae bacterium]
MTSMDEEREVYPNAPMQVTDELHQQSRYAEWNARTNTRGRASTQQMLDELAALGFAWRDVAKLVGVSVAAIQKWRRGEGVTGANRQKVASLLAACDLACEHCGIQEVASWFEMPLRLGVPVTPVDLWACGRSDLVLNFASGHADSEQVLTGWDSRWRDRYRSDFDVFRGADGQLSIRPEDSALADAHRPPSVPVVGENRQRID